MDILKVKMNNQWVAIPAIVGPSGVLVVPKTETGTELEIESVQGNPNELSVAFQWSQGDTTNISPTSPVTITTAESCTIIVNETEYEQSFSSAGSKGVGKGTWNAITGALSVTQKAVLVTADMVTDVRSTSTTGEYAAVLNLGVTIDTTATNNGILACSHYKIGQDPGIWMRNGTLYLYHFDTNELATVKATIAALNMVVIVALSAEESYSLTGKSITLPEGENTVSVDTGTMTLTYNINAKKYIDDSVGAVEEIAEEASESATSANTKATANGAEIKVLQNKVYKFTETAASNTGTGQASASDGIKWGFHLNIDPNVCDCWSILVNPSFTNNTGTYTATRWKNANGTPVATGETLTKVKEVTADKGTAILFEKLGLDEFVSLSDSCYYSNTDGTIGISEVPFAWINPSTGAYTAFSGYLSGSFTLTTYKPIKADSMLLYGKNITLIGDSITEKNGRANVNHGMWLERWTGCKIQNLGVGGTGFKRTAGSTYYKNRISSINADADIIGVAASFNDMIYTIGTPTDTVSDDTVCGYANEFFDTLLASFPTARIVCYSEGPWYNRKPGDTTSDSFISAMKTICENKGIVWDDGLYRGCALRPWIEANCEVYYKGESGQYTDVVDNVHPNSAGQKVIARYLQKLFEKVVDD